jgi:hypothetical protein
VGVAGVLLRREALAGLQAVATRRDPRTGSDFFTQQQEVRNLPDGIARVFWRSPISSIYTYSVNHYLEKLGGGVLWFAELRSDTRLVGYIPSILCNWKIRFVVIAWLGIERGVRALLGLG